MSYGKKLYDKWNGNNTLFGIRMGSNDIWDLHNYCNITLNINDYCVKNNNKIYENMDDIITIIYDKIEKMYEIGGKNFMVMNLPPFDLSPKNLNKKFEFLMNEIAYFNSLLSEKAKYIFNKYKDINIIIYNINEEYRYIMKEYKSFNFTSGSEMYIQNKNNNPDKYFWNDYTHLTEKGNEILAEDINDLLQSLNENK